MGLSNTGLRCSFVASLLGVLYVLLCDSSWAAFLSIELHYRGELTTFLVTFFYRHWAYPDEFMIVIVGVPVTALAVPITVVLMMPVLVIPIVVRTVIIRHGR